MGHNFRSANLCDPKVFPSSDSDYDVRFIYLHPLDWYLSIEDKQVVIELPITEQMGMFDGIRE